MDPQLGLEDTTLGWYVLKPYDIRSDAMPKAYSYLRFSTPEQAMGDSFRRQTKLAEDYALAHELELDTDTHFRDLGVSAYHGANSQRGHLARFRRLVEDGDIAPGSYLLVENLDRLSRQNPWQAQGVFRDLVSLGITIVTLQDGKEWSEEKLRENSMMMVESIFYMTRSHEESLTKSRRLKAAWKNKRENASPHKPLTSIAPSWLRWEGRRWSVIEEKADVVRRICDLYCGGMGAHGIAETMNRENVPTLGGGEFRRRSSIVKVLTNHALVGTFVPHTVEIENGGRRLRRPETPINGYFPPLIAEDQWQQIASKINREGARGKHAANPSELAGLLRCAKCGATVIRKAGGKRDVARYICSRAKAGAGCFRATVKADTLLAFLSERLRQVRIEDLPSAEELDREIFGLSEEVDGKREEARNLATQIAKYGDSRQIRNALRDREEALELAEETLRQALKRKRLQEPLGLRRRLEKALKEIEQPASRSSLNGALKGILEGIMVDLKTGEIDVSWLHGGETHLGFFKSMFPAT
jgi:DNA invertase Pin-like site-specific DNA recombinase